MLFFSNKYFPGSEPEFGCVFKKNKKLVKKKCCVITRTNRLSKMSQTVYGCLVNRFAKSRLVPAVFQSILPNAIYLCTNTFALSKVKHKSSGFSRTLIITQIHV